MRRLLILTLLGPAAMAAPALASSPQAWEAFRKETADRCVQAARAAGMDRPQVIVHPWGTDGHGVAVLVEGSDKRICLMDKRTKTVELTPAT